MILKDYMLSMPIGAKYILDTLHNKGFDAYIVGGFVRDSLLKEQIPHDCDICTNAKPEQLIAIFKDNKIILTGIKHGTITICYDENNQYEVTTFRAEQNYSDGRHSDKVSFVNDLKEDLRRRDFTINALAYNEEEGLIDYFDGINDLKNGIIRTVGFAEDRFKEDGLRILRAYRFSAQLGFTIDYITRGSLKGIFTQQHINNISAERIREELNKILLSDNAKKTINNMVSDRIFKQIFKGNEVFDIMLNYNQNNPYHNRTLLDHILTAVEIAPKEIDIRLALFLHDIGKPYCVTKDINNICHYKGHAKQSYYISLDILKNLKYDNKTIDMVSNLIYQHDYVFAEDNKTIKKQLKRLLNKFGEEFIRKLIIIRKCDILAQAEKYCLNRLQKIFKVENILNELLLEQECFQIKDLAINGKDLIQLGFKQGKKIGKILETILNLVIEEKITNTKSDIIPIVKAIRKGEIYI